MEPIEEKVSQEDLGPYYKCYSEPDVLALRDSLDKYVAGSDEGMEFVIEPHHLPDVPSGLKSFDKDMLKSRFIVFNLAPGLMGGRIISIIFPEFPAKVLDCWIYRLADGSYDFRGIWQNLYFDEEKMKVIREVFKEQLADQEHAL